MTQDIGNPFVMDERQAALGRALDAVPHVIERPAPWYWSAENVRRLLEFLFETNRLGDSMDRKEKAAVIYYLEKPHKWGDEWREFLKANPEWKP